MSAAPVMVSVGDYGVLNRELPQPLSHVWLDRDVGWLDFNDRVLAEALDNRTPLLERGKFLAIFTSNLDEFYMKRVATLRALSNPERVKLLGQVRQRLVESLRRQAGNSRRMGRATRPNRWARTKRSWSWRGADLSDGSRRAGMVSSLVHSRWRHA